MKRRKRSCRQEIKASLEKSERERKERARKLGLPPTAMWKMINMRKKELKQELGLPPTASWKDLCEHLP